MTLFKIRFLPEEKASAVEQGTTLAEAARQAGIFINNSCGGEGLCGSCRMRVLKGKTQTSALDNVFFSDQELKNGFCLACQTPVEDNLEVEISQASGNTEAQIVMAERTLGSNQAGLAADAQPGPAAYYPFKPLARKIAIQPNPPSLKDNLPDLERIFRELRHELGWHSYDISLPALQDLALKVREPEWRLAALLVKNKDHYRIQQIEPANRIQGNYGIALDVGTTTVVAQLVDLVTGRVLGVEGVLNLQAQYGEDVISRIVYACEKGGLDLLQQSIIANINQLIQTLTASCRVNREEIHIIVAAGNTTMSHLLLGINPKFIRLEPYTPCANVYPQISSRDLGIQINSQGILELIPGVASYVGGDIVAGTLACGLPDHMEVQGLIDIGTNGEIAIGNKEWLVCCSASAGPAFEGSGTSCGMRAVKGAIESLTIQNGQVAYKTIGNAKPRGLCGSGLIDCIFELKKNNLIGADGKFQRGIRDPRLLVQDQLPRYVLAWPDETEEHKPIYVNEADLANLIKSKGAVFAAIKSLVDYLGLSFDRLEHFYVAGGFGNYLDISKAIAIGLLPDMAREKISFVGNSSLTGARLALTSEMAFERCLTLAKSMTHIELSNYQPYMDEYIAALFLPHTDRKLFPSVKY